MEELQDAVRRCISNLKRCDRIMERGFKISDGQKRIEESILDATTIVRAAVYTQRQRRA